MTFFTDCHGFENGPGVSCLCLPKNKSLEEVVNHLKNGVHSNSLCYSYHSAGGLDEVLHQQAVASPQLHALNQTQALLGKATSLSDYKRLVNERRQWKHLDSTRCSSRVLSAKVLQRRGGYVEITLGRKSCCAIN